MSRDLLPQFFPRIPAPFSHKLHSCHDQARRAETALHGRLVHKCLLDGIQLPCRGLESFRRQDVLSVRPHGQVQAGIHGNAVHKHRTGAAFAYAAAFFDRSQVQLLPQCLQEGLPYIHRKFFPAAIYIHIDNLKHSTLRLPVSRDLLFKQKDCFPERTASPP